MAKLLSKLGIQETTGIETLTDLTKVLPQSHKGKERDQEGTIIMWS